MRDKDDITSVMSASHAYACVECGRCVAVCPMAEMYPNFSIEMSPRGVIKKVLMGADILADEHIWYCTECNAGTDVCPAGVSDRDLIRGLRRLAIESGKVEGVRTCQGCGERFVPVRVMEFISDRIMGEPQDFLRLCPACRRKVYLLRNA
ncbi:MAG: 4Fe-4S dicluster domain-containing protein [Desulfomonilia bacterium]